MDNPNQQVPPTNNNMGNNVPPTSGPSRGFMETLEYYLVTKAPFQIPANIKEIIVKIAPWGNVIYLLTIIPLILLVLGLSSTLSRYGGYGYAYGYNIWSIYNIISLATFVLIVLALPGLFKRKISGWNFTLYEVILVAVGGIISGNIFGAIIGAVIGLYFLFQVRSYYN